MIENKFTPVTFQKASFQKLKDLDKAGKEDNKVSFEELKKLDKDDDGVLTDKELEGFTKDEKIAIRSAFQAAQFEPNDGVAFIIS